MDVDFVGWESEILADTGCQLVFVAIHQTADELL